jgi:hypothetical protein
LDVVDNISCLQQLLNKEAGIDEPKFEQKIVRMGQISSLISQIENDISIKSDPEIFQIYRMGVSTLNKCEATSSARNLLLDAISKGYDIFCSSDSSAKIWYSTLRNRNISSDILRSAVSVLFEAHDMRKQSRKSSNEIS